MKGGRREETKRGGRREPGVRRLEGGYTAVSGLDGENPNPPPSSAQFTVIYTLFSSVAKNIHLFLAIYSNCYVNAFQVLDFHFVFSFSFFPPLLAIEQEKQAGES